jgi:RNA polymerase sigma factor (sigma-70 family)
VESFIGMDETFGADLGLTVFVSAYLSVDVSIDTSFEQLVQEHQAMVFRTLMRLTGSREHLEDLAQDVFLRLYRSLPNFRGEALVTTYLYRIVVNVAQNEWKRRRRDDRPLVSISDDTSAWEDRLEHPSRNAEEQLEEREFEQKVEGQLQGLSNVERSVLVLYHQEERSYEQIAFALGLPIGTVRTQLHRGRKKLREGLQTARVERRTACSTKG